MSTDEDARGGLNAQLPTPNAQLPKQAALRGRILPLGVGRWALNASQIHRSVF